jgi:hypothetical protein
VGDRVGGIYVGNVVGGENNPLLGIAVGGLVPKTRWKCIMNAHEVQAILIEYFIFQV